MSETKAAQEEVETYREIISGMNASELFDECVRLFEATLNRTKGRSVDLAKLRQAMTLRKGKLSGRRASVYVGVSHATFARVLRGSMPDLLTYLKLCNWLECDLTDFVV